VSAAAGVSAPARPHVSLCTRSSTASRIPPAASWPRPRLGPAAVSSRSLLHKAPEGVTIACKGGGGGGKKKKVMLAAGSEPGARDRAIGAAVVPRGLATVLGRPAPPTPVPPLSPVTGCACPAGSPLYCRRLQSRARVFRPTGARPGTASAGFLSRRRLAFSRRRAGHRRDGILRSHLARSPPIFTDMVPKRTALTDEPSLFPNARRAEPLASRVRPRSLDEFVGQTHLLGGGSRSGC
jgi:hypothetical protein